MTQHSQSPRHLIFVESYVKLELTSTMSIFDTLIISPWATILVVGTSAILSLCIYRIIFHPLSHISGPLLPKTTSLWLYYHSYIGDEATVINQLHKKYGPLVRIAPNEVDINDADAISQIYVLRGGFPKAPCYANFDMGEHQTIFSTLDSDYRSPRAKAVMPLFSTKNIRENEAALYGCVDRMVNRTLDEAKTGQPVNILNLTRSLALDAVTTHLFGENYNGISEKGNELSASAFVDAFVSVGRLFYMPKIIFIWFEWFVEKVVPDVNTKESMEIVDRYVDNLVERTKEKARNYPGRLLDIGVTHAEVKVQCKDLMFAGTDSTGANLARICQELSRNTQMYRQKSFSMRIMLTLSNRYRRLRAEILSNSTSVSGRVDIQALPYLSGVVKEGLRISMANPTRLPRLVPSSGWTFKDITISPGSIVGCSAYELHFNPIVFPDPDTFRPERWLEGSVTPEMLKHSFGFGAGSRACIARNLATTELYMATEKLAESGVLLGARPCQNKIEIYEWFNSSVKQEKIELVWEQGTS